MICIFTTLVKSENEYNLSLHIFRPVSKTGSAGRPGSGRTLPRGRCRDPASRDGPHGATRAAGNCAGCISGSDLSRSCVSPNGFGEEILKRYITPTIFRYHLISLSHLTS